MALLPDTPRWYYARNRIEEGDAVLQRLHELPIEHPNVQAQKTEILEAIHIEEESENQLTILSLFWDNTELRVGRRIVSYSLLFNSLGVLTSGQ